MLAAPLQKTDEDVAPVAGALLAARQSKPKTGEAKLDSLTSLRFIAAAMIVVSHSVGHFHLDPHQVVENLPLAQGVSFFFVLSGFILTYVYQDLQGLKPFMHFLAARIARVWPVFFVAAVLTFAVWPATMLAKSPSAIAQTIAAQFLCCMAGSLKGSFIFP